MVWRGILVPDGRVAVAGAFSALLLRMRCPLFLLAHVDACPVCLYGCLIRVGTRGLTYVGAGQA